MLQITRPEEKGIRIRNSNYDKDKTKRKMQLIGEQGSMIKRSNLKPMRTRQRRSHSRYQLHFHNIAAVHIQNNVRKVGICLVEVYKQQL